MGEFQLASIEKFVGLYNMAIKAYISDLPSTDWTHKVEMLRIAMSAAENLAHLELVVLDQTCCCEEEE